MCRWLSLLAALLMAATVVSAAGAQTAAVRHTALRLGSARHRSWRLQHGTSTCAPTGRA